MGWLPGNWAELGTVVGKAVLLYGTTLLVLRMGETKGGLTVAPSGGCASGPG